MGISVNCNGPLILTLAGRGRQRPSAICGLNQSEVAEVAVARGVTRGTDGAAAAHLAVTSTFCDMKM